MGIKLGIDSVRMVSPALSWSPRSRTTSISHCSNERIVRISNGPPQSSSSQSLAEIASEGSPRASSGWMPAPATKPAWIALLGEFLRTHQNTQITRYVSIHVTMNQGRQPGPRSVCQASADKESPFELVILEHNMRIRAFVRSLGADPDWVDDIAQEAFIKAYRDWDPFGIVPKSYRLLLNPRLSCGRSPAPLPAISGFNTPCHPHFGRRSSGC